MGWRQGLPYGQDLREALLRKAAVRRVEALRQTIGLSLQSFQPDEPANYFANSGYGQP